MRKRHLTKIRKNALNAILRKIQGGGKLSIFSKKQSVFFFESDESFFQREILIPTLMITLIVLRQKSLVRNAPKSKLGICTYI